MSDSSPKRAPKRNTHFFSVRFYGSTFFNPEGKLGKKKNSDRAFYERRVDFFYFLSDIARASMCYHGDKQVS